MKELSPRVRSRGVSTSSRELTFVSVNRYIEATPKDCREFADEHQTGEDPFAVRVAWDRITATMLRRRTLAMSDLPFVWLLAKASAALEGSQDPKAWAEVNRMRAECGLADATCDAIQRFRTGWDAA